jgi:alpha-L-fucosidase
MFTPRAQAPAARTKGTDQMLAKSGPQRYAAANSFDALNQGEWQVKIQRCLILAAGLYIAQQMPLAAAESITRSESNAQRLARMKWWQEARFGMFIHWGPVSLKGTEIGWSRDPGPNGARGSIPAAEYDGLYKQFNPVKFSARGWVATAKAAGMKYLVFTTKHHDGFCEFDSKLTDYKITNGQSPFHRDVVKELADACHEAGIRFGVYHSQPDSHHADYRTAHHDRYIKYLHGQVGELLSNYGRVDVIWFDGLGGTAKDWDAPPLFRLIKQLQPDIIINDRCGLAGDFSTPEQTVGAFQIDRPWETCMTICNQWAWKPGDEMKSLKQCLHVLITCAGGDGNLLFNVGPMPTGEIEPRQVVRLKQMGQWMEKYGQTIYGTRGGPYKPSRGIVSTRHGDRIYVHVLRWNGDSIELPLLPVKILSAALLTGGDVKLSQAEDQITLIVPKADQRPIDTIIELKVDGSAEAIPPLSISGKSAGGLIRPEMKATASNVYAGSAEYSAEKAIDNDTDTRWATDAGTHKAWLEIDLGRPLTFTRAAIDEAFGERVQAFELQSKEAAGWKSFCQGKTIGEGFSVDFPAVTAQRIRLNIQDANEGPTITSFQIFAPGKK